MRQGEIGERGGCSTTLRRAMATAALSCVWVCVSAGYALTASAADGQDAVPGEVSAPAVSETPALQTAGLQTAKLEINAPASISGSIPVPAEAAVAAPVGIPTAPGIEAAATPAQPRPGSTGILGLHSDLTFSVLSAPRQPVDTTVAPDAEAQAFAEQVKRIAGGLQVAAQGLYPERVQRIGAFDVYVAGSEEFGAMSSGTGKIAVNAGLAKLKPTDDWLAFVIAREMGHVVSGHHDSNAGASLAVSVIMNLILPGSGLIKSAISFASSQVASESGRDRQTREADDAALKLLEAAGYTAKAVALNLRLAPLDETANSRWATTFRASALQLVTTVQGPQAAQAIQMARQPAVVPALTAAQSAPTLPVEAQSAAAAPAVMPARWQPDEIVRARPSGLPGPLLSGGFAMPVRRIE